MKISIITPSYNSAKTISDTIDSVISQTHQDLEYLVIDGISTDGTIAIVNEYQRKYPIRLVSEKDSGIYDAMNKGIKLTTGDIIGILNSDDFYYDQNVLAKINDVFAANPDVDAVYGDLVYVDQDNTDKQTRYWRSGKYQESKINGGWIIPHPTLFVKREVYNKSEKIFDTSFSLAADYEFILRSLKINKIKVKYLSEIVVKMRAGGASGSSLKQRIKGWKELRRAWKVNNLPVPCFFIIRRILSKFSQFLSRPRV